MAVGILLSRIPASLRWPRSRHPAARQPSCAGTFEVRSTPTPVGCLAGAAMRRGRRRRVLILTDLYGASPSNLPPSCATGNALTPRVGAQLADAAAGDELSELPLEELPAAAAAGARNGVVPTTPEADDERELHRQQARPARARPPSWSRCCRASAATPPWCKGPRGQRQSIMGVMLLAAGTAPPSAAAGRGRAGGDGGRGRPVRTKFDEGG